jgi:hypothetical protein
VDETPSEENTANNQNSGNGFLEKKEKVVSKIRFRIINSQDEPISSTAVTIHSTPQTAVTNEDGIVSFHDITEGTHTLTFSYQDKNFKKTVDVRELENKDSFVELKIITDDFEETNLVWKSWIFGTIVVIVIIVIVAIWLIWKKRRGY